MTLANTYHLTVIVDTPEPGGRSHTISLRDLSRERLAVLTAEYPLDEHEYGEGRPATWGECQDLGFGSLHKCPYVSCKHNLAIDVHESTGTIVVTFPDADGEPDFDAMTETCSLAVADRGEHTLEEVGNAENVTRERVRQIESRGLKNLREEYVSMGLDDFIGGEETV